MVTPILENISLENKEGYVLGDVNPHELWDR